MPFAPGAPGRPKGAENLETKKLRLMLSKVTDDNAVGFGEAMEDLRKNYPIKFVELYLKLLEYSMPKLRSIEASVDLESSTLGKIIVEIVAKDGCSNTGN